MDGDEEHVKQVGSQAVQVFEERSLNVPEGQLEVQLPLLKKRFPVHPVQLLPFVQVWQVSGQLTQVTPLEYVPFGQLPMQAKLTRSLGDTQEVHLLIFAVQVKQSVEHTRQFCPLLKVPSGHTDKQVLL